MTVTAKLADGFAWGQLPPWVQDNPTTATFAVDLVGTTCDEVTPVAPTNHAAQCVDGALTPPTLTLAETDGISYSVDEDPPYAPGQTVVVTATFEDAGRWLARPAAAGMDGDIGHDRDAHPHVRRRDLHAGAAG